MVVPNWNGARYLEGCLSSLESQTFHDMEVVVVDNGSTDESEKVALGRPATRLLPLGRNLGFAAAVNAGIRSSRSELVALLNNDARAHATWIEKLVDAIDDEPTAGFAASRMVLADDPGRIDAAGDRFSLWRGSARNIGAGQPASRHMHRAWVFGACAGAAMYRRSMLDEIGLFDERFFLLHEDVDLDMRARRAGYRCLYVPQAVVEHVRSGSTDIGSAEVAALAIRNCVWVAAKNLPLPLLLVWAGVFIPRAVATVVVRSLRHPTGLRVYADEVRRAIVDGRDLRRETAPDRRRGNWQLTRALAVQRRPL